MLCSFYTRTSSLPGSSPFIHIDAVFLLHTLIFPDHHHSYTSMLCSFYTHTSMLCSYPFTHSRTSSDSHRFIGLSLSLSLRLAVLPPSPVSLSLSRATIATTLICDERRTLLPCARPSVWPCLLEVGGVPKLHADDGDRAFATVLRKRRTL